MGRAAPAVRAEKTQTALRRCGEPSAWPPIFHCRPPEPPMCRESREPIFVTKNGYGDMVIMSMELYERKMRLLDVYEKLSAAEAQVQAGKVRDAGESLRELRKTCDAWVCAARHGVFRFFRDSTWNIFCKPLQRAERFCMPLFQFAISSGKIIEVILFIDQKTEHKGAARKIHKASCADRGAVEYVRATGLPRSAQKTMLILSIQELV